MIIFMSCTCIAIGIAIILGAAWIVKNGINNGSIRSNRISTFDQNIGDGLLEEKSFEKKEKFENPKKPVSTNHGKPNLREQPSEGGKGEMTL